jgi:site-specific recombinase XerD
MTNVRGNKARVNRTQVITEAEFKDATEKAALIKSEFLRLRAFAVLCLLRLTGKRRTEIAMLPRDSLKTEGSFLNVTFVLLKKRKGNVLQKLSTKSIPLADPLVKPVLEYYEFLKAHHPDCKFLFPSGRSVFGQAYIIYNDKHLSGRQVFNIVRGLSQTIWPHLFRETVASDVIKEDSTIIAAFKVQRRLDLESYTTGFNYLRRFSSDVIKREMEQQAKDA